MTDHGFFGPFGGRYVPEVLVHPLEELEEAYRTWVANQEFQQEYTRLLAEYSGRPTPLYQAQRMSDQLGGGRIYLKREDLNHTGSHKINNTLGQVMLARTMGKTRIIAETGAGQHGVATATACALFGLECVIYMGAVDVQRQKLNVFRMQMLGAEVIPVTTGSQTLKDAINAAMRDWVANVDNTYYVIGSVVGPHPYPTMVRDFQSVIGRELRTQLLSDPGRLPDQVFACVGGGSNAMGVFSGFMGDPSVQLIGVEAGGLGLNSGCHAASLSRGSQGILHGSLSYILQDNAGQIQETHSVAAGLDYPGVGPEHSQLMSSGRVSYRSVTDREALEAFTRLAEWEGIIPALESAHAVAQAMKSAPSLDQTSILVVCLSGRGDKDVEEVRRKTDEA